MKRFLTVFTLLSFFSGCGPFGSSSISGGNCRTGMMNQANPVYESDSSWTPAGANIIGYYKFNGTSGAIGHGTAVTATTGPDGTASNSNGTGMTFAEGKLNQALSLDGTDDYVDLLSFDPYLQGLSSLTVSLWANIQPNSIGAFPVIQHLGGRGIALGLSTAGTSYIALKTSAGGWFGCTVNHGVMPGNWVHLSLVWNAGILTGYANGVEGCSVAAAGSFTTAAMTTNWHLRVGRHYWGGATDEYFKGSVDELTFWNTALSPTEISTLYTQQVVTYSSVCR